MISVILLASSLLADQRTDTPAPAATATSARTVIISGDRLRIGTSRDVIEVQGLLLSASQVSLPSAPVALDKKQEQQVQPPDSQIHEPAKPTPPRVLDRQK